MRLIEGLGGDPPFFHPYEPPSLTMSGSDERRRWIQSHGKHYDGQRPTNERKRPLIDHHVKVFAL